MMNTDFVSRLYKVLRQAPSLWMGILMADVYLGDIDYPKAFIDVVGHYARPDLLSLLVNSREAKHVTMV